MASATPPLLPIRLAYHVRILDDAQLRQLMAATLEIFDEIGMHCPSTKAVSIFAEYSAARAPLRHRQTRKNLHQGVVSDLSNQPAAYKNFVIRSKSQVNALIGSWRTTVPSRRKPRSKGSCRSSLMRPFGNSASLESLRGTKRCLCVYKFRCSQMMSVTRFMIAA
jgi:hypothetical protein